MHRFCVGRQKRFTSLDGSAEQMGGALPALPFRLLFSAVILHDGADIWTPLLCVPPTDLKSMVLHDMSITHTKSSFPICKSPSRIHSVRAVRFGKRAVLT